MTIKKLSNICLMALALLAFASCKTESKLSRYKDIYAEKPVTIYITPTIDQAERPNKKITDKSYNNQLDVARHYMRHSLMKPFETKGYYVFGPLVSAEIAKADNIKLHIVGYADNATGDAQYNQKLSLQRAQTIADELVKLGVNKANLTVEGKGGVATLDPASYNRRVIIEAM